MYKGHKRGGLRSEAGNALIVVLLVMLVFSGVGMTIMQSGMNSVRLSSGESRDLSAYYIAESGITYTMDHVRAELATLGASWRAPITEQNPRPKDEAELFGLIEANILPASGAFVYTDFEKQNGHEPVATVAVTLQSDNGKKRTYRVVSTGTIGDRKRTLETTFAVDSRRTRSPIYPENLGVYAQENMQLINGTITGNLMIESAEEGVIEVTGKPNINGTIYVLPSEHDNAVDGGDGSLNIVEKDFDYDFSLPPFPVVSPAGYDVIPNLNVKGQETLKLERNTRVSDIKISNSGTLTVDVGDKDVTLYVGKVDFGGDFDVRSSGGSLTLYVVNGFAVKGTVNASKGNDLYVYVTKNVTAIDLSNSEPFDGSLYAETADLDLGGNGTFSGMVMTGGTSVKMHGTPDMNSPGMIVYAPNALVELVGTAQAHGIVISKTFELNGNTAVYARPAGTDDHPFFDLNEEKIYLTLDKGIVKEIANN